MDFVQIIEFDTDRFDEMQALDTEWEQNGPRDTMPHRVVVCADRDRPGHYFQMVFFDSYEKAMKNSEDPFTGEMAAKMQGLAKGPATFHNLDVVDEQTF
jgi:hypothetical protein